MKKFVVMEMKDVCSQIDELRDAAKKEINTESMELIYNAAERFANSKGMRFDHLQIIYNGARHTTFFVFTKNLELL